MAQKKLRFWHTEDLNSDPTTWREVFPLGPKTFQWKREKKEIFFRQKQKGGFQFINRPNEGVTDFDFFIAKENDPLERCKTRYIIVEKFCGSEWEEIHRGKFTLNDCEFDLDKCTIDAKQSVIDDYTCLKDNKKEKYNILASAPVVKSIAPLTNNFDFLGCRNKGWLDALVKPCDGTGGWKKFFTKTAVNTPQPRSTVFTDNAADDYYNALQTKDHAAWIKKVNGAPDIYTLEIYRFVDSTIIPISGLDSQSTLVNDKGMFAFTSQTNRRLKTYRPDTAELTTIVTSHSAEILWFDIDDTLGEGYCFYYDANNNLFAYDFDTGLTRKIEEVDVSVELATLVNTRNISYGDGLLAYHDNTTKELKRYNPQTFLIKTIETVNNLKFLVSEDSFLTWFNIDNSFYNLQNRDDSTLEVILLRDLAGSDSRYNARENEWIAFDISSSSSQVYYNLITRVELFSLVSNNAGGPGFIPTNLNYKIENGWFIQCGQFVLPHCVYLDSFVSPNPNSAYKLQLTTLINNSQINNNTMQISAGVERIYYSGVASGVPFPKNIEIWSIDMKDGTNTLVEDLGIQTDHDNDIRQILMNGKEQVLTINKNRVHIYKEDIQRNDELTVWFRQKTVTICIGGLPTAPSGSGWTLYQNQCNQFGISHWVKQPAMAAPGPSFIFESDCVCEDLEPNLILDKDECTSINPNSQVVDFLMNPTTSLNAGTIIGPIDGKQLLGATPQQVTFYIEKARNGSTYTWVPPGFGSSIVSGQGTNVCVMEFTTPFALSQVTCQETNPCEIAPIPIISHPFEYHAFNFSGPSATVSIPILVEVDTYSGATIKFIRAFDNPWPTGTTNTIIGESSSSFSIDTKNRTVLTAVHNGVTGSVTWSGFQGATNFSGSCNIVSLPTLPAVSVAAEVCPTGHQTYTVENPRANCTYSWKVDSPAFIVGIGVGNTVLVDMGGAVGTEMLHLSETCPVQPANYQLIAPCDELHSDSWWWTIGGDISYSNCRLLKNVVEDLITSICPDIDGIVSEFFQWNSLTPSNINYVTGKINELNFLTIAQKSDIKDPNATEKATIGELTFDQFVKWCRQVFEVYWFIQDNKVHFEHISIITGPLGLDLTQGKYPSFAKNQNQYKYDKFDMPRRETFEFEEGENAEFVGFPIEYKDSDGNWSDCVNQEDGAEKTKELTTDLKFIQTNAAEIERKGFVILANTFDGTDYRVISNPGTITGINILNEPLSWSSLQENFMQHDRILAFGWMNRAFRFFKSSQFFKKQDKFRIPLCCGDNFDPLDLIKTELGTGKVEEAEIDYKDDLVELKLKYE